MTHRDPRFAELDRLIAAEKQPKYRRTMSAAALAANRANAVKAHAALATMTPLQRYRHARRAQSGRKYPVSCSCGTCPKCRHREAKRRYNRKLAAACRPVKPVYPAGTVPHGTFTGYNYHGCRCQECRACIAANARRRKVPQIQNVGRVFKGGKDLALTTAHVGETL